VDYLGQILRDEQVRIAIRRKRPLLLEFPDAPAAACVRALAKKILGDAPAVRSRGFFKRFASAIHAVLS
jgi:hypothetical protein